MAAPKSNLPPAFLKNVRGVANKGTSSPALEKREERVKQDLDGDQEKGESTAHRAKVLRPKKAAGSGGKGSGKMCAKCKAAGKSSCSHL